MRSLRRRANLVVTVHARQPKLAQSQNHQRRSRRRQAAGRRVYGTVGDDATTTRLAGVFVCIIHVIGFADARDDARANMRNKNPNETIAGYGGRRRRRRMRDLQVDLWDALCLFIRCMPPAAPSCVCAQRAVRAHYR